MNLIGTGVGAWTCPSEICVIGVAPLDTAALDIAALLAPPTPPAEDAADIMLPLPVSVALAVTGDAAGTEVTGDDVAVGVTSVRPVPEEIHTAPLGYECAGLHA